MKKILYTLFFLFCFINTFAQNAFVRGDSIFLTNRTKSSVIVLQNATKDSTGAFAKNMGHGVVNFKKILISDVNGLGDSLSKKIYFSEFFKRIDSVLTLNLDTVGQGNFLTWTAGHGLKQDTNKYFPKVLHANFSVQQNGDTVKLNGPFVANPLQGVFQSNPGARESSDFAVFGSGVNTSTNPKLLTSIHGTVAYRAFMRGSTSATPLSGTDAAGLIIGDQDITAAAGGSYAMFNQLAIKPLHIINTGGATIDSAYTLNITGAPTGAGVNGALKVKGGVTLLDLPAITGGTSLVVDAGGNVGTGSGGGSLIDGSGTTAVGGNQVNLGGTLTGNFDLDLNSNAVNFHNYNSFTAYDFITADNPSATRDSANYGRLSLSNTGLDIRINKDISHQLFVYMEQATRVGFHSAVGIDDGITHNGIEISNINHAAYTNNSLANVSYVDSTSIHKADSVVLAHPGGTGTLTTISGVAANGFTWSIANPTTTPAITLTQQNATTSQSGQLTSTDWNTFNEKQTALGFTPENVANKSTTTTLGTSNTLYPTQNAVKTYVDNAVSGVTVPTGANPTATAGATAVNGSATTFMRSDAAPKVDSTVFQTVLNFFPKGDTRYLKTSTASSTYALQSTTISPGTGLSGGGSLAANRTLTVDTTVIRTTANSLTLAQLQTTFNTKQATLVSGTNIKTVNSNSLLGSGNVAVGDALVANPLSQFASTTSAQLLGVLSDETGSGAAVFGTSPTLATPVINGLPTGTGVASAGTASTLMSRDVNANTTINNLIENYQTIATAALTTTLDVTSPYNTYFTGTQIQTEKLPVVSTLVLGMQFATTNNSSAVVTVQSSGGNTVQAMAANTSSIFTCIAITGTGAASWAVSYSGVAGGISTNNTWTGNNTFNNQIAVNGFYTSLTAGGLASNLAVAGGDQVSGASTTPSTILFGGATTVHYRGLANGETSSNISTSANAANYIFGPVPVGKAASGTHLLIANVVVKPIVVNAGGGASLTNTATIYGQGASTATVTGSNYDVWAIGLNRMDSLQTVNLKLNGAFGAANQIPAVNSGGTAMVWANWGSKPHTIFTPTTGGTVTLVNGQYNIINPAGALLALTVNLPSSPANNDCVFIKFTQNVTTVTYGNGTVVDGITAPTAGGLTVLVYDSGTSSWY